MASPQIIDVGPLWGPGRRTIAIEADVTLPDSEGLAFTKAPHVVLELHGVDRAVRVEGTIDADLTAECRRCLDDVPLSLHVDVDERIAADEQGDPFAESNVLAGERLNLGDLVRQLTTAALPMVGALCSEECRGLCPKCGRNRNDGACTCPPPEKDMNDGES
ncbi:MAG: DUF177 domain-containing protein [Candidatus Eremiobacteraeota bacterium]|nr:DUF177 domain-containing protein [Candidatus Eremiobacteraeota bacterium]